MGNCAGSNKGRNEISHEEYEKQKKIEYTQQIIQMRKKYNNYSESSRSTQNNNTNEKNRNDYSYEKVTLDKQIQSKTFDVLAQQYNEQTASHKLQTHPYIEQNAFLQNNMPNFKEANYIEKQEIINKQRNKKEVHLGQIGSSTLIQSRQQLIQKRQKTLSEA